MPAWFPGSKADSGDGNAHAPGGTPDMPIIFIRCRRDAGSEMSLSFATVSRGNLASVYLVDPLTRSRDRSRRSHER